ncbi:N-acetylmuramic acid 6-phosphate etherase [Candidatus Methylacidiphilum infernorum]|uniref:N-acetylmuramic acid 6-phosphate etherase n=1 Tax=Candidatus Methylacidiphilum infernorum TaxID=511746 RepID=A0ABX7PW73_9BACT|nr:N-acetylmuramic acid 6-phosphate etherase [Candidatus Methylacidiphilum infernorum]QSR87232.1 N-acetylmuramic acid 6-phosphate etherase [Candidatus Methylacidiphilum infernorum]
MGRLLGIEGGATHTRWMVVEERDGKVLSEGKEGAGNFHLLSRDELFSLFRSIRERAGEDIAEIGVGFAGCQTEKEKEVLETLIREIWPGAKRIVVAEDSRSAYAGAFDPGQEGLLVIGGTGSNVIGYKGGVWEKAGGWGQLGDPGSGYRIGREGLERIYLDWDLTQKNSALGLAFLRHCCVNNLAELLGYVLAQFGRKDFVASFAPLVLEMAEKGDASSLEIVKKEASALALRVQIVAERLGFTHPRVALVGGLFENSPFYTQLFGKELKRLLPFAEYFVCRTPGPLGALRLLRTSYSPSLLKKENGLPSEEQRKALDRALTEERNPRSCSLEKKTVAELVDLFIAEESYVQSALEKCKKEIESAALAVSDTLAKGGRLFYVGAGTSGRLGVLDASEMPPTFNVSPEVVQAIMAGGAEAVLRSMEGIEDDSGEGYKSISSRGVTEKDIVCGITASGRTPFVIAALEAAKNKGARTILLSCNPQRPPCPYADIGIDLPTGPEIVAGSTRLKAGTATKIVLNMFSTIAMIRTGKVKDNLMINLQPKSMKLRYRSLRILMTLYGLDEKTATALLEKKDWLLSAVISEMESKERL